VRNLHLTRPALSILSMLVTASACADEPVYELRVYTCNEGKLPALHERFHEYTMILFARHGMENIAYWTPTDEPRRDNTLIYILRHKSREAAAASWEAFRNDPEWKQVARASQEKHGKILSIPPESTYMKAADYSPEIGPVKPDSLYELRTYTAAEGTLERLHDRFRTHTDRLFQKHGMKPYGYWLPLDQPRSANTMIYVIEHPDRELARAAWKAFGADPEWQTAKKASEEAGPLLIKDGIESLYLKPVEYTP
jgi:NIPSNAP